MFCTKLQKIVFGTELHRTDQVSELQLGRAVSSICMSEMTKRCLQRKSCKESVVIKTAVNLACGALSYYVFFNVILYI